MIEANKYEYETTDGRHVTILPQVRVIDKKKVYIGLIAGEKSYRHWNEQGQLFGENEKAANLK